MNYNSGQLARGLRELLASRGLTAGDVARGTGLSRQAIYQILSGKTRTPKGATLERIASFLRIPVGRLRRGYVPDEVPEFLRPDSDILSQIPDVIGPELAAMIERELPDNTPLRLEGPSRGARQDILKMKLYLILKKRKLDAIQERD